MERIIFDFLEVVALVIGIIGVLIISLGALKGVYFFIKRDTFWSVRVVLVKHIMLGLDFLISRDIIETVILKSDKALWIDLAALVLIIVVRVVFSFFAEKEMEQLMDEKKEGFSLFNKKGIEK